MTASRILRDEAFHLVLVEIHIAGVGVGVLVVNVEFTALAASDLSLSVFAEVHIFILSFRQPEVRRQSFLFRRSIPAP